MKTQRCGAKLIASTAQPEGLSTILVLLLVLFLIFLKSESLCYTLFYQNQMDNACPEKTERSSLERSKVELNQNFWRSLRSYKEKAAKWIAKIFSQGWQKAGILVP